MIAALEWGLSVICVLRRVHLVRRAPLRETLDCDALSVNRPKAHSPKARLAVTLNCQTVVCAGQQLHWRGLKTVKLEGEKLTFDVGVVKGELTGADGAAALFIDR